MDVSGIFLTTFKKLCSSSFNILFTRGTTLSCVMNNSIFLFWVMWLSRIGWRTGSLPLYITNRLCVSVGSEKIP